MQQGQYACERILLQGYAYMALSGARLRIFDFMLSINRIRYSARRARVRPIICFRMRVIGALRRSVVASTATATAAHSKDFVGSCFRGGAVASRVTHSGPRSFYRAPFNPSSSMGRATKGAGAPMRTPVEGQGRVPDQLTTGSSALFPRLTCRSPTFSFFPALPFQPHPFGFPLSASCSGPRSHGILVFPFSSQAPPSVSSVCAPH